MEKSLRDSMMSDPEWRKQRWRELKALSGRTWPEIEELCYMGHNSAEQLCRRPPSKATVALLELQLRELEPEG